MCPGNNYYSNPHTLILRGRRYKLVTDEDKRNALIHQLEDNANFLRPLIAITLALGVRGADPFAVTEPQSPFMRAADDLINYSLWSNEMWSVDTRPMYFEHGIALRYTRYSDHTTVVKIYPRSEEYRNEIIKQLTL